MITLNAFGLSLIVMLVVAIWFVLTLIHLIKLQRGLEHHKLHNDPHISWYMNFGCVSSLVFKVLVFVIAFCVMVANDPSSPSNKLKEEVKYHQIEEKLTIIPVEPKK
uniref:Uncharacterized protein n=1 Tax=Pseudomonas phage RVTF4 TaxID=3236931 RepID=A0AB39CD44_9VIRU